jgi:hypothetical protein
MIGTAMGPEIIMTKYEIYECYLPGLLCADRHKIKIKPTLNSHKKNEKHPYTPHIKGMSCQTFPRSHNRIQNT